MKQRRNSALLVGAALLSVGIAIGPTLSPAGGQSAPESILPPGFGDTPAPTPPAERPAPRPRPTPAAPGTPLTLSPADLNLAPTPAAAPAAGTTTVAPDEGTGDAIEEVDPDAPPEETFDVPETARRPVDGIGPLGTGPEGLGAGEFGRADGRFLSTLMRRMNAPIASRWGHMLLRRALLTATETPARLNGADWVAERAWLLLRMGEADAARMLVDSIDVDQFTPKLLAVAAQVALANADPAALCPLQPIAATMSKEPIWPMARAMCAGLSGEPSLASALIDQARRGGKARGIDVLLAEKVVGAGNNGRRSITIEWEGVDALTAWRFGVASALAVPIPDGLYNSVGPHVRAWAARAPMLAPEARVAAARTAARLGVFSSATLVDLYGAVADRTDVEDLDGTDAGRLRTAYIGDRAARLGALSLLWGNSAIGDDAYAADILTARAAAGIAPGETPEAQTRRLISAMFSAGLDIQANRWATVVADESGLDADAAWAMLAVGAPQPEVDLSAARIEAFVESGGGGGPTKSRLLIAALAGLGRMPADERDRLGTAAGIDFRAQDSFTRVLDAAAARGEAGTVAILAATGMQTPNWQGVPPAHFYRILTALNRVGLDGEARMMAAEAMARL
ncbi:hypothetical protein [Sphingomonas prati]|uniref:Antifreeze protein n=1 Tax=Sphingomonas prati TaxID=1843237 RepID=A0A7W9F1N7_9SPHN|nr:hypothetical protein [Sphingomonas prati]MBB5729513.1 hypothetical protein [Sphingomonas prati]GGE76857.1 hypothetical protein GCM10011404_06920 [Sphingomonas prati]